MKKKALLLIVISMAMALTTNASAQDVQDKRTEENHRHLHRIKFEAQDWRTPYTRTDARRNGESSQASHCRAYKDSAEEV